MGLFNRTKIDARRATIADIKDIDNVNTFIKILEENTNDEVRAEAARRLRDFTHSKREGKAAVYALNRAATDDDNHEVRYNAVDSLSYMARFRDVFTRVAALKTVKALDDVLLNHKEKQRTRLEAAATLGFIGSIDPGSHNNLETKLASDHARSNLRSAARDVYNKDKVVRAAANQGLEEIHDASYDRMNKARRKAQKAALRASVEKQGYEFVDLSLDDD